jgi:hypothetical protein
VDPDLLSGSRVESDERGVRAAPVHDAADDKWIEVGQAAGK